MKKIGFAAISFVALLGQSAAAQDVKAVVATATKALGADSLTSVTYYGQAANFNLGQNNNANGPWPRTNVDDYRRTIDFSQPALRATGQTFAAPVQGGPAVQGNFQQLATLTIDIQVPRSRSSGPFGSNPASLSA